MSTLATVVIQGDCHSTTVRVATSALYAIKVYNVLLWLCTTLQWFQVFHSSLLHWAFLLGVELCLPPSPHEDRVKETRKCVWVWIYTVV